VAESFAYNEFVRKIEAGEVDPDALTYKIMLLSGTGGNPDNVFVSSIVAGEIAPAAGYTGGYGGSGRKTLTGVAVAKDDATNTVKFDADDAAWTGTPMTAGTDVGSAEVIVETGGSDATAYLCYHIEFAGGAYEITISDASFPFRVKFHASGIARREVVS
jgi:hypothetical protein